MARIYIYDEGHANERVLSYLSAANTPDYEARTDVVIYDDASNFPAFIEVLPYWRHDTGVIRDMNQAEKDALDAEIAAAQLAARRVAATALADAISARGVEVRAILQMSVTGDNLSRQWLMDFQAAVAGVTNLAEFKAAVAALDSMPQWTKQQAKDMYLGLITDGSSDT